MFHGPCSVYILCEFSVLLFFLFILLLDKCIMDRKVCCISYNKEL